MFKRILMLLLISSILGYGSVWAFDGHIDEVEERHDVAGDTSQVPDGGCDSSSCDHCCHASAHILALWPLQTGLFYSDTGTSNTPYQYSLSFLSIAPPERPPQA